MRNDFPSVHRCWGCLPNPFFPLIFTPVLWCFDWLRPKQTHFKLQLRLRQDTYSVFVFWPWNQSPGLLPPSSGHQEDFPLPSLYWSPYWKIGLSRKLCTLVLGLNGESDNGWLLHLLSLLMASMWSNKCFNSQMWQLPCKHWQMKLVHNKILDGNIAKAVITKINNYNNKMNLRNGNSVFSQ